MGTRLDPDLWIWKKNREKFWDIKKILDSVAETSEKTQCFRYSENPYELEKTLTKIKKILDEGSIKEWSKPSDKEKLEAVHKLVTMSIENKFDLYHNDIMTDMRIILEAIED